MIETRSEGTGVWSLKVSANFFKSLSLISLSFLSLLLRIDSTFLLCWVANVLKALATSRSTVAVAFGAPSVLTWGEAVLLAEEVVVDAEGFGSGVAEKLDSVVVGGVATSNLDGFALAAPLALSAAALSGRASCDDMMAGSTGAPLTVACPEGARFAGGVYLLLEFEELKGGKSCCLRTPLYLSRGKQEH